jgi:precorrin-2 dehydrogenase/sirohydrochlorin ferrochelatase
LREFFEEIIPEDISQMVLNLKRNTVKPDFEEKVQRMNEVTASLKQRIN